MADQFPRHVLEREHAEMDAEIARLGAQVAALREALRPFALLHENRTAKDDVFDEICVSGGLRRDAAKLLEETEATGGE